MRGDHDEEAWRAIVENYGERPTLDPGEVPGEMTGDVSGPIPRADRQVGEGEASRGASPDADWSSERFLTPPPPPGPPTTKDRLVAWAGLFGAPAVLLASVVLGLRLPDFLTLALVAAFVAGFGYLVLMMPRGPRDPDDDGACL